MLYEVITIPQRQARSRPEAYCPKSQALLPQARRMTDPAQIDFLSVDDVLAMHEEQIQLFGGSVLWLTLRAFIIHKHLIINKNE